MDKLVLLDWQDRTNELHQIIESQNETIDTKTVQDSESLNGEVQNQQTSLETEPQP